MGKTVHLSGCLHGSGHFIVYANLAFFSG